jgi:hypothetical protein
MATYTAQDNSMAQAANVLTKSPLTISAAKAAIAADVSNDTLTLTFSDGREIVLRVGQLDGAMQTAAMLHGLKQKLVDAAAIARDTETGRSATLNDKYAAVKEIYDRITSDTPSWNKIRGDGMGTGNTLLVRAMMQFTGKTKAAIDAYLDTKSKEEKLALRKNPKIANIIAELQAAGADDSIDTDAMLDELM